MVQLFVNLLNVTFVVLSILKRNVPVHFAQNDLITWINWFIDDIISSIESLLEPFGKSPHWKPAMLSIKPPEAKKLEVKGICKHGSV